MIPEPNEGAREIEEMIQLKMGPGRYSRLLVRELYLGWITRTLHVHMILDEIAILEGRAGNKRSIFKPETKFKRAPLKGLWHKHFMQASYIWKNLQVFWSDEERLDQLRKLNLPPDQLLYQMVIGGYSRRTGAHRRKTRRDRRVDCVCKAQGGELLSHPGASRQRQGGMAPLPSLCLRVSGTANLAVMYV
jgi:hypothetical protein